VNLDAFETVATGLDHPEGVSVGPDGLLYAGGEAGQVYRIGTDGTVEELASTGGFLYGVVLDGDGNVYACDFGNASVKRISPGGEVSTFSTGTLERPMRVPNFAAFDESGNLFVTDSGEWGDDDGVVYRVTPRGDTSVWTTAVPRFPNGCCMSAECDALLVVESRGRAVMRVPIDAAGAAGEPEALADLTGAQPDGIALAADGTMFVGCYRPDRVYRVSPDGTVEVWADDPDGVILNQPANVAFLGDRLVVSSLGGWSLMAAPVDGPGLPLHYPSR
jgi:gluconolactonase